MLLDATWAPAHSARGWTAWLVGVALALAAGAALGGFAFAPKAPPARALEFDVTVPDHRVEMGSLALSPDGSALAFTARDSDGRRQLFARRMDSVEARALPGAAGAPYPFWSPEGR